MKRRRVYESKRHQTTTLLLCILKDNYDLGKNRRGDGVENDWVMPTNRTVDQREGRKRIDVDRAVAQKPQDTKEFDLKIGTRGEFFRKKGGQRLE